MLSNFIQLQPDSPFEFKKRLLGLLLTRGQLVSVVILAPSEGGKCFIFLRTDWRTNRLWLQLDQPRQFLALLRFERRYIRRKA